MQRIIIKIIIKERKDILILIKKKYKKSSKKIYNKYSSNLVIKIIITKLQIYFYKFHLKNKMELSIPYILYL